MGTFDVTYAELARKETVQVELISQKQEQQDQEFALGEEGGESAVVAQTVTVTGADPGFGAERTLVEADEPSK